MLILFYNECRTTGLYLFKFIFTIAHKYVNKVRRSIWQKTHGMEEVSLLGDRYEIRR